MKSSSKTGLGLAIIPLLACVMVLQSKIDPQRAQYEPGDANARSASQVLPIEFALGALSGFREAIAGVLWVRVDEFFDQGNYAAITPLIRIITWLDPHNTDVYMTGAWHMDYNFTDQSQRSDRRYLPLAIALMKEGIANNVNDPDMYSDLGFTHYFRKIGDFENAMTYFKLGQATILRDKALAKQYPTDQAYQIQAQEANLDITTVGHLLAHAYEACGMIPEAEAQWQWCIDRHEENVKAAQSNDFSEKTQLRVAQGKLKEMQMRALYRRDLAQDPVDMEFAAQLKRIAPREFVVSGTMNVIGAKDWQLEKGLADRKWAPTDGARVEIRLQDYGYKMPEIQHFSLNSLSLASDTTIMQETASLRGGKFTKKIDMSQDPDIYSFHNKGNYEVTLWFNPANPNDCPPQVQDRVGWLGEGMTDKRYLDTSGVIPGDIAKPVPGLRLIKKTFILSQDDLLGQGPKTFE